jgi:hypothetical protein
MVDLQWSAPAHLNIPDVLGADDFGNPPRARPFKYFC